MEGSLRNADVLVLINSRVPERLKEIDAQLIKLVEEQDELRTEKSKLEAVHRAALYEPVGVPSDG